MKKCFFYTIIILAMSANIGLAYYTTNNNYPNMISLSNSLAMAGVNDENSLPEVCVTPYNEGVCTQITNWEACGNLAGSGWNNDCEPTGNPEDNCSINRDC